MFFPFRSQQISQSRLWTISLLTSAPASTTDGHVWVKETFTKWWWASAGTLTTKTQRSLWYTHISLSRVCKHLQAVWHLISLHSLNVNNSDINNQYITCIWCQICIYRSVWQETHVIHKFKEDFYGQILSVAMVGYIRPERGFTSLGKTHWGALLKSLPHHMISLKP